MTERQYIRAMLYRMGSRGQRWCKGTNEDEKGRVCLSGAMDAVDRQAPRSLLRGTVRGALEGRIAARSHYTGIPSWNDDPNRRFRHVRALLLRVSKQFAKRSKSA